MDQSEACGFAQLQSNGEIQAHLSLLAVRKSHRRQGIGQKLIAHAFQAAGGKRIDLVTDNSREFYQAMNYSPEFGFRLYPETE